MVLILGFGMIGTMLKPRIDKKIATQINEAPEPLHSYIHDLETTMGNGAHLIQESFILQEQINLLTKYIEMHREKLNAMPIRWM